MQSIWTENCELPRFEPLRGDLNTEVLIIGGGITGLLCAQALHRAGIPYALVEAGRIAGGTTRNTTAKITAQHGLCYHTLLRRFGPEKARLYYLAHQEALAEYRTLCREMDCDFREQDSFVYSRTNQALLEREMAALATIGATAELAQGLPLPFETAGAVKFPRQAQFHPLKFLGAVVPGLNIYENTPVLELAPGQATTPGGKIHAKHIIVATHFPLLNKHGSFFLKLYQHRSYVLALENAEKVDGMYVDEDQKGLSFRNQGELLILGGGSHRTGKQGGSYSELEAFAQVHYPGAAIHSRWATQDCMSLDGMAYIGPYSSRTQGLYTATGYSKWGMTSAMVASRLLTDRIQGKPNPYADLFSPCRSILHPQLAINAWEAAVHLCSPTTRRCPHLGCALKWDPQERTWDCPCHGSRFTGDGRRINGPATGDLPRP